MRNLILCADSYKHSHFLQYPPEARNICGMISKRSAQAPKRRRDHAPGSRWRAPIGRAQTELQWCILRSNVAR